MTHIFICQQSKTNATQPHFGIAPRCCLTTRLAHHSPEMLPTASAGWNRHQLAANVSVPAAIRGGDQVSEETPSELSDQLSVRT